MHEKVLVTGRPGIGKTSVVETVAREFPDIAGGFTTSEIHERGVREGFRVTTLGGESAVLAHVDFRGRYESTSTGSPCLPLSDLHCRHWKMQSFVAGW